MRCLSNNMKKLSLIYILPLLAIASCKKDHSVKPETTGTQTTVIASVKDSVSYTIDGVTYAAGDAAMANESSGTEGANRKLTVNNDNNVPVYSLVGSTDSIMYFHSNQFASASANIKIHFLKKFVKQQTSMNFPGLKSVLSMFAVGKYPFAEDFNWQNSQNGLAIDVAIGDKGYYSSYVAFNGPMTVAAPAGFQKSAVFEITRFDKATDEFGGYNLEAKFTAVVLASTGEQKQLENGYLRLHFYPSYAINGY